MRPALPPIPLNSRIPEGIESFPTAQAPGVIIQSRIPEGIERYMAGSALKLIISPVESPKELKDVFCVFSVELFYVESPKELKVFTSMRLSLASTRGRIPEGIERTCTHL